MDVAFADGVRELLTALASGGEPSLPDGRRAGARRSRDRAPPAPRAAVEVLVDRWFRAAPPQVVLGRRRAAAESARARRIRKAARHAARARRRPAPLAGAVEQRVDLLSLPAGGHRRLRRTPVGEIVDRPLPSNRPLPEYARFIGRQQEVATLLRWLGEAGGTTVGVEGPGGSGKTALLHAVVDACENGRRSGSRVCRRQSRPDRVPLFDAFVWVACAEGSGLATLLEAVARTLDYPGLLARSLRRPPPGGARPAQPPRRAAARRRRRSRRRVGHDVSGRSARPQPRPGRRAAAPAQRSPRADARPAGRRTPCASCCSPKPSARARPRWAARWPRPSTSPRRTATRGCSPRQSARCRRRALPAAGRLGRRPAAPRPDRRARARAPGAGRRRGVRRDVRGLGRRLAGLRARPAGDAAAAGRADDRATLLAAGGEAADVALDELLETSLLEASGPPTDEARRYELHAVTRSFVRAHLPLAPGHERRALARLAAPLRRAGRNVGRRRAELALVRAARARAAQHHGRRRVGQRPGARPRRRAARRRLRPGDPAPGATACATCFRWAARGPRAWCCSIARSKRRAGWPTRAPRVGTCTAWACCTTSWAPAATPRLPSERARRSRSWVGRAICAGVATRLRLLGRATRARGNLADAERLLMEAEALLARARPRRRRGDRARQPRRPAAAVGSSRPTRRASTRRCWTWRLEDPVTEANVRKDLGEIALARTTWSPRRRASKRPKRWPRPPARGPSWPTAGSARRASPSAAARPARAASLAEDAADLFERLGDLDRAYEARSCVQLSAPGERLHQHQMLNQQSPAG